MVCNYENAKKQFATQGQVSSVLMPMHTNRSTRRLKSASVPVTPKFAISIIIASILGKKVKY